MALSEQEEFELLALKRKMGAAPVEDKPAFAETPGGAATGVQMPRRVPQQPANLSGSPTASILGAGAAGAAFGTVAPEMLTGAATITRAVPQLAPVSNFLDFGSRMARVAGRPATTVSGGLGGLAGEAAGQASDAAGGGKLVGEGVRFIAGGLGAEAANAAKSLITIMAKVPSLSLESKMRKEAFIKPLAAKLEGRPQDISQQEADQLNALVAELRGGAATDKPMRDLYEQFKTAAAGKLALGETEARNVLTNAQGRVNAELEAMRKDPGYAQVAAGRIANAADDAVSIAQMQRLNIGNDVHPSELGGRLRDRIRQVHGEALTAREAQIQADKTARDAVITAKEQQGVFANDVPSYQALLAELEASAKNRSPDVRSSFTHILNSIKPPSTGQLTERQVLGYDPKPKAQLSFQQLDDVRRELGQVFQPGGKPAEGYAAIDANIARKYYDRISQIQKDYAGPAQEKLLSNYASASDAMSRAKSGAGQRALALDKYDDELYKTDASALPRRYFSSAQEVNNLLQLTGDKELVTKAAKDFAATELAGKTERQVREWMTSKREMLAVLPEVRDSVLKYANTLAHGEYVDRTARVRLAEAEKLAANLRTDRGKEAVQLLGPHGEMFPKQNIDALIKSGSTSEWAAAAPVIHATPGGRDMLLGSLRQHLSEKALTSTKGLSTYFNDTIAPALRSTKTMDTSNINDLSGKLLAIENMKRPEVEKLGLARRLILQSFAAHTATVGGRVTGSTLMNLIPREENGQTNIPAR